MGAYQDIADLAARVGELSFDPLQAARRAQVDESRARRAAVLLLFGALDHIQAEHASSAVGTDLDILLMERAGDLEDHPGEISLPGGGVDATDESIEHTALREAYEETGVDISGIEVMGSLPDVGLPISNFLVTPVLGYWHERSEVTAVDPAETSEVFAVPVADLLNPENRYTATLPGFSPSHDSPAFQVNDVIVWGFTGALLSTVFKELGWEQAWDASRTLSPW